MADLLTIEALAERYATTTAAVRIWRTRGDCPPAFKVGRRLMFRLTDVVAWEEARLKEQEASQCNS